MKTSIMKKGFTLIELLVVITIIGILATGGITVYTGQIQKARDSTRVTAISELESAGELVYQEDTEYPRPTTYVSQMSLYVKQFPSDPKHGSPCNNDGAGNVACGYSYVVSTDINGIDLGEYEYSTAFEYSTNRTKQSLIDGGNDVLRKEIGNNIGLHNTAIAEGAITVVPGACLPGGGLPVVATDNIGAASAVIVISGSGSCV